MLEFSVAVLSSSTERCGFSKSDKEMSLDVLRPSVTTLDTLVVNSVSITSAVFMVSARFALVVFVVAFRFWIWVFFSDIFLIFSTHSTLVITCAVIGTTLRCF